MNKIAITDVMEEVIYLTFVAIFIIFVLFYLSKVGTEASLIEEIYAKQIGLALDKATDRMELEIGLFNLYEIAQKQKYSGSVVVIDNEHNIVKVTAGGKGFEHEFFSDLDIIWSVDTQKKILFLSTVKPGGNNV